jgi:hypothetical protein
MFWQRSLRSSGQEHAPQGPSEAENTKDGPDHSAIGDLQ